MTLGSRVGLALLLPVLLLLGMAVYQVGVIDRLVEQNREIGMVQRRMETAAVELREALDEMEEFADKARATEDPVYRNAVERSRSDVEAGVQALLDSALEGEQRRAVEETAAAWRVTRGVDVPGSREIEQVDGKVVELLGITRAAAANAVADGARQAARARRVSTAIAIGCVVVAALLVLILARMVTGPVRGVARAARDLAEGDFARRAPVSGAPELSSLARDFNRMAEKLGEIDRLKETLIANVSHDLKAPLASIYESSALLLEEIPGPLNDDQRRLLAGSQESNQRLSRMVTDLLDLSRLQAGAMVYDRARLDLNELVRTSVSDLAAAADARQVAVEVRVPDSPTWLDGDQDLLLRVMENLLSNAIRYSPVEGEVAVELAVDAAGTAILAVRDHGPGIPDEHKARVFERFYRVGSPGGQGQGTGIGLAIAASVAAAHDGSIHVEDEPGGGSRFELRLPAGGNQPAGRPRAAVAGSGVA